MIGSHSRQVIVEDRLFELDTITLEILSSLDSFEHQIFPLSKDPKVANIPICRPLQGIQRYLSHLI
jgi:hypothetical protein